MNYIGGKNGGTEGLAGLSGGGTSCLTAAQEAAGEAASEKLGHSDEVARTPIREARRCFDVHAMGVSGHHSINACLIGPSPTTLASTGMSTSEHRVNLDYTFSWDTVPHTTSRGGIVAARGRGGRMIAAGRRSVVGEFGIQRVGRCGE